MKIYFLLLFFATFAWGLGVGKYQWFPHYALETGYRTAKYFAFSSMGSNNEGGGQSSASKDRIGRDEDNAPSFETLFGLKNELSGKELLTLRSEISQHIVPAKETVVRIYDEDGHVLKGLEKKYKSEQLKAISRSVSKYTNYLIETDYYGITSRGYLTTSGNSSSSNCLRVYIQGHGGNPFGYEYFRELRDAFVNNGCDVLSLSMLGLGFNEGTASFPSNFGLVHLSEKQASLHGNYSFFFDHENSNLDPLSLFLYPQMNLIKYAVDSGNYTDITVLGISGGGWYTVWLSALLPEVDFSISYAGTLPLAYRKGLSIHGDWEQLYSNLYKKFSYLDLYQLMLVDSKGKKTRKSFLIYNDNDDCCFMDASATNIKSLFEKLDFYPDVIVDRSDTHDINVALVNGLLESE